jgi:putative membrane protein
MKKNPWRDGIVTWLILSFGVWVAAGTSAGIYYDSPLTLFLVAALIGLFNAILRPIMVLLALPFVVLTFGVGVLLINAVILSLVSWLAGDAFVIESFWSALWGAFVIAILSLVLHAIFRGSRGQREGVGGVRVFRVGPGQQPDGQTRSSLPKERRTGKDDDVIDV